MKQESKEKTNRAKSAIITKERIGVNIITEDDKKAIAKIIRAIVLVYPKERMPLVNWLETRI